MEQIQHFDQLTIGDSTSETCVDEEGATTRITADHVKFVAEPSKIQYDHDTLNLDRLVAFDNDSNDLNLKSKQYSQLLLSSETIDNNIPEEQPNDENQTISNGDGGIATSDRYPEGSVEKYGLNQWSQDEEKPHLYIRNQSRNKTGKRDISECDIRLQDLPSGDPTSNTNDKEMVLYHTTDWKSTSAIIKSGIQINNERGPQDQAIGGAYYLNDSYADSYQWCYTNNSSYRGEHATLIYKLNPWELSENGEELTQSEWKRINQKRNTDKHAPDWSYTFQNSRPAEHSKQGKNPSARQRSDGTTARQLIVRSQKMCDKMNSYCIACIYYEKIDDYSITSTEEQATTSRRCRYSNAERKRKRQKSKIRSMARDCKRFCEE